MFYFSAFRYCSKVFHSRFISKSIKLSPISFFGSLFYSIFFSLLFPLPTQEALLLALLRIGRCSMFLSSLLSSPFSSDVSLHSRAQAQCPQIGLRISVDLIQIPPILIKTTPPLDSPTVTPSLLAAPRILLHLLLLSQPLETRHVCIWPPAAHGPLLRRIISLQQLWHRAH